MHLLSSDFYVSWCQFMVGSLLCVSHTSFISSSLRIVCSLLCSSSLRLKLCSLVLHSGRAFISRITTLLLASQSEHALLWKKISTSRESEMLYSCHFCTEEPEMRISTSLIRCSDSGISTDFVPHFQSTKESRRYINQPKQMQETDM